jgi:hypothetical protein
MLYVNPVVPGQTGDGPVIGPGVAGVAGFTVIGIPVLVAVVGDAQVAFDVSITVTTSLFARVEVINVGLFDPAFIPFTCH